MIAKDNSGNIVVTIKHLWIESTFIVWVKSNTTVDVIYQCVDLGAISKGTVADGVNGIGERKAGQGSVIQKQQLCNRGDTVFNSFMNHRGWNDQLADRPWNSFPSQVWPWVNNSDAGTVHDAIVQCVVWRGYCPKIIFHATFCLLDGRIVTKVKVLVIEPWMARNNNGRNIGYIVEDIGIIKRWGCGTTENNRINEATVGKGVRVYVRDRTAKCHLC